MKDKTQNTLRWIVLPFASIIAAILAFAFCQMCQINESHNEIEEGFGYWFWAFLSFFSSGCAFVYVAIIVAPRQKHIVAIVATSIAIVVCLIWCITGIVATLDKQNSLTVFAITSTIGGIMGALVVGLDRYSHFKKLLVHSTTLYTKGKYTETKNKEAHLEKFNDYNDIEGPQKVVELLLKQHTKEQAIDIIFDKLEKDLSEYEKDKTSDCAWDSIDKSCRILDILQPLNRPDWYSDCKTEEELAELITIDYERINASAPQLTKLSKQCSLRAKGIRAIMTGPAMKVQADKLSKLSAIYSETISLFLYYKGELGCAALEKKIWRDLIPGNPISSQSYLIDGYVLGFIFNGKVYINKEFPINIDKAYIHLYTYLWMEYCKKDNFILYQVLINLAKQTNHFHHIRCSKRFLDINEEEAAIKALCYIVAFDGGDIFLDDKRKKQLMSSELAEYKTFDLPRMINLTIDEAKRLPLISFIRGDKISDKDICGEIKFYNSKQ